MKEKTFVMLKGLPGAGKTRWAKEFLQGKFGWFRVSNDDLRLMGMNRQYSRKDSLIIKHLRESMINHLMYEGVNILLDNCNLNPNLEDKYRKLCKRYGYTFKVVYFKTPLELCIRSNRGKKQFSVPENTILKMFQTYLRDPKLNYPVSIHDAKDKAGNNYIEIYI